jgi:Protein of unknown function (DUF1602).
MRIKASFVCQFFVGPLLDYFTVLEHHYLVRVADGGEPVSYHERGSVGHKPRQGLLTSISLSVSRALVASSRIRIGGFLSTARAIAILCLCPPESLVPLSPMFV